MCCILAGDLKQGGTVNIEFSQMVNHARVLHWRQKEDLKCQCSLNGWVFNVFTSNSVVVAFAGSAFHARDFDDAVSKWILLKAVLINIDLV